MNSAIGRSSLTSEFTIWSSTGCDWLLSSIAVISEMNFSGSSTSALASSSGRSKTIDTNISPPSFLMSSGRPSWARFRNADRLPVVVRFSAGPRVRLKTVDPPKGNGLGQKKSWARFRMEKALFSQIHLSHSSAALSDNEPVCGGAV